MVNEFVDTYSDDLCYLIDARNLCMAHLVGGRDLCNAAFCRMAIIFVIGTVEMCLTQWHTRDGAILNKYFACDRRKLSNEKKCMILKSAFQKLQMKSYLDAVDDYLAMKYIRNTIVHSRWVLTEKEYVCLRGFPTDLRKFNNNHWERIQNVNTQMLLALKAQGWIDSTSPIEL